jgi:hypothetical protein
MPKQQTLDGKTAHGFGLMVYVDELRECDHCFLTVEGADYYSKPFGFTARTYVAHANPHDIKGLTLDSGAASARGIAAEVLARQICDHVGVAYQETMGRGSQLRKCCDALEAWMTR